MMYRYGGEGSNKQRSPGSDMISNQQLDADVGRFQITVAT
jgi:hypothetical protein